MEIAWSLIGKLCKLTYFRACSTRQVSPPARSPSSICPSASAQVLMLFGWLLQYPVPSMPSQIPVNFKTSPPPTQCCLVISLKDESDCALISKVIIVVLLSFVYRSDTYSLKCTFHCPAPGTGHLKLPTPVCPLRLSLRPLPTPICPTLIHRVPWSS